MTDDGATGRALQTVLDTRETVFIAAGTDRGARPATLIRTAVHNRNGSSRSTANCDLDNECTSGAYNLDTLSYAFELDLDDPYFHGTGSSGDYDRVANTDTNAPDFVTASAPFYFWSAGQQPLLDASPDDWRAWGAWAGTATDPTYTFFVHGNATETYAVAYGEYKTQVGTTFPAASVLPVNATWSGAMVGRDTGSGAYLQGDVLITLSSRPVVDVALAKLAIDFTDIVDAVSGEARADVPGSIRFVGASLHNKPSWTVVNSFGGQGSVHAVFHDTTQPGTDRDDFDALTGIFTKPHSAGGRPSTVVGAFGADRD